MPFWLTHLKMDISELEKGQEKATEMHGELKYFPFEVRLKCLGLVSLEKRRLEGDILELYNIIPTAEKVERKTISPSPLTLELKVTRGNFSAQLSFREQMKGVSILLKKHN